MSREKDLTGKQIGYLTVLARADNVPRADGRSRTAYHVRCECGTEKIITHDSLKKMKSCGCKWLDLHKLPEGVGAINHYLKSYEWGAVSRGHTFEITKDYFKYLIQQPCYYCGSKPCQEIPAAKRYNGTVLVNGIDRVDNSKGYTNENCVSCCKACNLTKGAVTLQIAAKIMEFYDESQDT